MKKTFALSIWCISFFVLFTYTSFSQTVVQTNLEKLGLSFPVNFTEKEKKFISSLSQTDLEKLVRVIKLIIEKSKTTTLQNTCTTEACKNQKLQEKCTQEKKDSLTVSTECKNLSLKALTDLLSGQRGNLDQSKLAAEQKKTQELKDEAAALSTTEKDTPNFNQQVALAQQGRLPTYSDSILNQTNLQGTPDFFDGRFVCNLSNNGTFSGTEKPRNQGGRIADSLFYGIANAAKASGAQVGSFGCFNHRTIAGSGRLSQHATGDACDVVLRGNDAKNTAFMVLFLANTGTHNTVGSYASRGFDHSHLGADCGGTWCPYQKGSGLEPWKALAFNAVYQACGKQFNPSDRPPKSWIQNCAKKAAENFCK